MAKPSVHLMERLKSEEIEKLTELLSLPPGKLPTEAWLNEQASRAANLPPRLLKPRDMLTRLGMSLGSGPDKAKLCKAHKFLNPYLIRRIFLQISAECTSRLARLIQNPFVDTNIARHVKRLQMLNSLWMSVDLYRVTYQVMPDEPRFRRIPGDCEACILAAVGGNPQTLCDLRSSMLGRKRKRSRDPRLLRLVDTWIKWTGIGPEISAESDILAREVRACRRDMQLARRQTIRNQREGISDESPALFYRRSVSEEEPLLAGEGGDEERFELPDNGWSEDEEDDPEGDIINHYAHSIQSTSTALRRPFAQDIHFAFRNPLSFQDPTSSSPRPSTPRPSPPKSTSYASITTIYPDRLSADNLRRLNDLPPRPGRPQNRSTYMDSVASARMSWSYIPIPLLRPRQQPAYTASVYSRDIYGRPLGESTGTDQIKRADEEQTREYPELMRRQAEEVSVEGIPENLNGDNEEDNRVPPIPRRSEHRETRWTDIAGNPAPRQSRQDGWLICTFKIDAFENFS